MPVIPVRNVSMVPASANVPQVKPIAVASAQTFKTIPVTVANAVAPVSQGKSVSQGLAKALVHKDKRPAPVSALTPSKIMPIVVPVATTAPPVLCAWQEDAPSAVLRA